MAADQSWKNKPKAVEPLPSVDGRVPPHDLEAEAAVLSAVMVDPQALDKLLEFLKPEHFYSEAHRRMFEGALELKQVGQPVDVVQIGTWLKDRGRLEQVGGYAYLTEVIDAAPFVANVVSYGKTIHEKWRVRQLIGTCQRVAAEGYLDYGVAQTFIDNAEQSIYNLARTQEGSSVEKLRDVVLKAFKKLNEAVKRGARITGTSSGFDRYDRLTSGLHDGDLTIVAARPGMGKTSFVLNIASNVGKPQATGPNGEEETSIGVMVFSLEMPREQLANRMVCSEARVDVSKLRSGAIDRQDFEKLTRSAAALSQLPIWIDDSPGLSLLELRAKVRRVQSEFERSDDTGKKTKRVGLIIIDYLQLMRGRDGAQSREQEISEISRGLKGLAKELSMPVIALSQLNRAVESRGDKSKRPQISDLRESGAIEQDADNIVFIYRDDYYNRDGTTEDSNIAELIIAKQRNGPTGTAKVRFDRQYTRFDNLSDEEYPEDFDE